MEKALKYAISLDSSKFENPLARAGSKIRTFGGKLKGLVGPFAAATAGAVGLAGGVAAMGKAINLAADLESTQVAMRVLIGDIQTADTLLKKVQEFGASTPFQFTGLADSTRLLLSFGSQAGDVMTDLKMLGDVAAGTTGDLKGLAFVYGKTQTLGRLMGEQLLQFSERGIPLLQQLASMYGKTNEEVQKMVSTGQVGFPDVRKAFGLMTGEGGKFNNMMGVMSTTTNGLISTLKDNVDEVFRAFGQPLNDALKPVLEGAIALAQGLIPTAQRAGAAFGGAIQFAFQAVQSGQGIPLIQSALKVAGLGLVNVVGRGLGAAAKTFGTGMDQAGDRMLARMQGMFAGGQLVAGFGTSLAGVMLNAAAVMTAHLGHSFQRIAHDFVAMLPDATPGKKGAMERIKNFDPVAKPDKMIGVAEDLMARGQKQSMEGIKGIKDAIVGEMKLNLDLGQEFSKNFSGTKGPLDGMLEKAKGDLSEVVSTVKKHGMQLGGAVGQGTKAERAAAKAGADFEAALKEQAEKAKRLGVDGSTIGLGGSFKVPLGVGGRDTAGALPPGGERVAGLRGAPDLGPPAAMGEVGEGERASGKQGHLASLKARHNRMSRADKLKAGSFEAFVGNSVTDKNSLAGSRARRLGKGAGEKLSAANGKTKDESSSSKEAPEVALLKKIEQHLAKKAVI